MRREAVACAFVFAIALASHLTYELLSDGDFFYPDSYTYLTPALNMLHGRGFITEDGPETLRTPGYPVFLLPFLALQTSPATIVFANHLLVAMLASAVYLLARRFGARRRVALAGSLVLAFDTITIHYANKILTEALSAALVVAIFVIALRRRAMAWLIAAGLLCGVLVLVRPVAVVYFVVITVWFLWTRVRLIVVAAFVASSVLLPVAWASRNAAQTSIFTISSIGAINLMSYRAAAVLAIEDGGDFKTRLQARQHELDAIIAKRVVAAEGVESPDELSSAEISPYYTAVAKPILLDHPKGVALITIRGFVVNMIDTDWDALAEVVDDELIPEDATRYAVYLWTAFVWLFSLTGFVYLWRRDRNQALLAGATIFYFLFMAAGGEAEGRFRVPVMPLIALCACYTFSRPDTRVLER